MGDNCLQGRREHRPREGPVAIDYVRSKPTRGVVGGDGENLRDPVGKQLGKARHAWPGSGATDSATGRERERHES